MDIGVKIKSLRLANNDTVKGLADKLQYNPSNLSKIEKGKLDVSVELLRKIIDIYDVNPYYFFGKNTEVADEEITEAIKLIRFIRQNLK